MRADDCVPPTCSLPKVCCGRSRTYRLFRDKNPAARTQTRSDHRHRHAERQRATRCVEVMSLETLEAMAGVGRGALWTTIRVIKWEVSGPTRDEQQRPPRCSSRGPTATLASRVSTIASTQSTTIPQAHLVDDFSTGLTYRHDRPRAHSISTRTIRRCLASIRSTYHSQHLKRELGARHSNACACAMPSRTHRNNGLLDIFISVVVRVVVVGFSGSGLSRIRSQSTAFLSLSESGLVGLQVPMNLRLSRSVMLTAWCQVAGRTKQTQHLSVTIKPRALHIALMELIGH
ncbi:hypothetical protein KCU95_g10, partial [Aureobasidium melanogenum]